MMSLLSLNATLPVFGKEEINTGIFSNQNTAQAVA
jgi:hypothetical protein